MRIRVDKMPEKPKDCLFVSINVEYGYVCPFQHSLCSLTFEREKCPCLTEQNAEGKTQ